MIQVEAEGANIACYLRGGRQLHRDYSVRRFAGLRFIDFEVGSRSVLLCALINLQVAERASATLSSKGGRKIDSQSCSLFVC